MSINYVGTTEYNIRQYERLLELEEEANEAGYESLCEYLQDRKESHQADRWEEL